MVIICYEINMCWRCECLIERVQIKNIYIYVARVYLDTQPSSLETCAKSRLKFRPLSKRSPQDRFCFCELIRFSVIVLYWIYWRRDLISNHFILVSVSCQKPLRTIYYAVSDKLGRLLRLAFLLFHLEELSRLI